MKTLIERITEANSDAAWELDRQEHGNDATYYTEKRNAKRAVIQVACQKAIAACSANPKIQRVADLRSFLTTEERNHVETRLLAYGN